MLFNSYTFVVFLAVVVAGRWIAPRRAIVPLLLAASYVFYACWVPVYLVLLVEATLLTYLAGLAIGRWRWRPRVVLAVGIASCLGALAYFKYAGFAVHQVHLLRQALVGEAAPPIPEVVLPLGISFFLFQMIAYLVDVRRGAAPERNPLRYALFIAFFPQLVAGPIVRTRQLLPQIERPPAFDTARALRGMDLLALGFVKKVCLSDNLALWADPVFDDPAAHGTAAVWVGVLAYTGQIYCDFSGYTDIARGAAKLLGYELPVNFRMPYLATDPRAFWRRWHITLSTWLRDYLYIPLGGNRRGRAREAFAILATMILGGLWHGASWTFVIWGLYHGLLLLLQRVARAALGRLGGAGDWTRSAAVRAGVGVATFLAVCLGWVWFRAPTAHGAVAVFRGLFTLRPTAEVSLEMTTAMVLIGALAAGHVVAVAGARLSFAARIPALARGGVWAVAVAACWLLATRGELFIYFQF